MNYATMTCWRPPNKPNLGTSLAGRKNSPLNWEKVQQIRADTESSDYQLARLFGVSHVTIWKIRHNRVWREEL